MSINTRAAPEIAGQREVEGEAEPLDVATLRRVSSGLLMRARDSSNADYVLLAIVLVICSVGFVLYRAWVADDGFITFRHVANCLAGYGPVFNVGERVQGFSHPLWFLILLAGGALADIFAVAVTAGLVLSVITVVLLAWFLRGYEHRLLCLQAVFLTLYASNTFVEYQTSGLETSLSTALVVALWGWLGMRAVHAQPIPVTGAAWLCSLLILTRPDLLILCAPVLLVLMVHIMRRRGSGGQDGQSPEGGQDAQSLEGGQDAQSLEGGKREDGGQAARPPRSANACPLSRRRMWLGLLSAMLPLLGWYGFATIYYGTPIPNTAYAKVAFPLPIALAKGANYALNYLIYEPVQAAAIVSVLVLGVVISIRGLAARRPGAGMILCLTLGILVHIAYVISAGGDFMRGRFFLPVLVAAMTLGAHLVASMLRSRDLSRVWTIILAGAALVFSYQQLRRGEVLVNIFRGLGILNITQLGGWRVLLPGFVIYVGLIAWAARRLWRTGGLRGLRLFIPLCVVHTVILAAAIGYHEMPWSETIALALVLGIGAYGASLYVAGGQWRVSLITAGIAVTVAAAGSLCDVGPRRAIIGSRNGIADEWAWYHGTDPHNRFREPVGRRIDAVVQWEELGESARRYAEIHGPITLAFGAIGIPSCHAGPQVNVIDWHGLTDPFIARGGAPPDSRTGHIDYEVPESYLAERQAVNLLPGWSRRLAELDPTLVVDARRLPEQVPWTDEVAQQRWLMVREVTTGSLFSAHRLRLLLKYALPERKQIPPWSSTGDMPRVKYQSG